MAKQIRQVGRALLLILPLVLLAVLFVLPQRRSEAAFTDPFWDNVSSSPECACANCPCEGAPEWFPEGAGLSVNVRTREVVWDKFLFRMPGLVEDNIFSLRWRSTVDGTSQLGRSVLPSWELTAEKVILDAEHPDDPGGHEIWIRRPTGRIDVFDWDGSDYSAASCNVLDVLTVNGSKDYVLADQWGNYWTLDGTSGMPKSYTDRNDNEDVYTYTGTQLTSYPSPTPSAEPAAGPRPA